MRAHILPLGTHMLKVAGVASRQNTERQALLPPEVTRQQCWGNPPKPAGVTYLARKLRGSLNPEAEVEGMCKNMALVVAGCTMH